MSEEPTREELLENSPEAVAMRRARAARAEAAQVPKPPPKPGATRRCVLLGVVGAIAGARALAALAGRQR
jgi:hypothetical protein